MTEQQPATDRSAAFDQETLSRFWAKVDKTDDCWLWTGPTTRYGYGVFWNGGKRYTAHRISYLLAHGDIPSDLVVDHLCHGWDENCTAEGNRCRHRACVNPNHLEAVTQQVNLLRGRGASGQAARRTHCPQGHPYDEVNTLIEGKTRRCRACREARAAATRTAPPPAERTHCPQGHPYSEENTYRAPNGYRKCRTCKREQDQRARAGSPRRTTSESHRLALSEALGLGTGAPWDAIYEQTTALRRMAGKAQQDEAPCCSDPTCACVQVNAAGRCECAKWDNAPARECSASISGHCLREAQSETACDTEDGECVYGGQPAREEQQDPAQDGTAFTAIRADELEATAIALEAQTCTCGCRRAADFLRQRAAVTRATTAVARPGQPETDRPPADTAQQPKEARP